MRPWVGMLLVVSMAAVATAEEEPQLRRMYDDALVQLKAAQERKNELANENRQLQAQLATLQQQLDAAKRQIACHAEDTYRLRVNEAAWRQFLGLYPAIADKWEIYQQNSFLSESFPTSDLLPLPQPQPATRPAE